MNYKVFFALIDAEFQSSELPVTYSEIPQNGTFGNTRISFNIQSNKLVNIYFPQHTFKCQIAHFIALSK